MKTPKVLPLVVVLVAMAVCEVHAQPVPEDVQKKLDAMMKRLDQQDKVIQGQGEKLQQQEQRIQRQQQVIEDLRKGAPPGTAAPSAQGGKEPLTPKQEQRVDDLVKDYLGKEENRVSLGLEGMVAGYKDGFFLASRDQSYKLKFSGFMDVDGRFIEEDVPTANTFLIRRARPTVSGTLAKYTNFVVMPDFGQGKVVMKDTFIDLAYLGETATFRLGKYKVPQGLEVTLPNMDTLFVELGLPALLNPEYDVGVGAYGKAFDGVVDWSVALFNGDDRNEWQGKTKDSDVDNNKSKDFGARLQVTPFKNTANRWVKGLQGAGWVNVGTEADVPGANQYALNYAIGPGTTFFKTTATTVSQLGERTRAGWDAAWLVGPAKVIGEWAYQDSELVGAAMKGNVPITAWSVSAAWLLTGEDETLLRVKPKNDFDPMKKGWGAWELAARWQRMEISENALPFMAAGSTDGVGEFTLGVNWYLNRNVKMMFNWDHAIYDNAILVAPTSGAGASKLANDEDAFMFRTQVRW